MRNAWKKCPAWAPLTLSISSMCNEQNWHSGMSSFVFHS